MQTCHLVGNSIAVGRYSFRLLDAPREFGNEFSSFGRISASVADANGKLAGPAIGKGSHVALHSPPAGKTGDDERDHDNPYHPANERSAEYWLRIIAQADEEANAKQRSAGGLGYPHGLWAEVLQLDAEFLRSACILCGNTQFATRKQDISLAAAEELLLLERKGGCHFQSAVSRSGARDENSFRGKQKPPRFPAAAFVIWRTKRSAFTSSSPRASPRSPPAPPRDGRRGRGRA